VAVEVADDPARSKVAMRALAQTATRETHFTRLGEAAATDVDLAWRTLVRRAEVGAAEQAEVEALQARDPDPDSWVRALAVAAARPDLAGKDAAWKALVEERRVPMGSVGMVGRTLWRRSQDGILAAYRDRYLEVLPILHRHGMIPAMSIAGALFPRSTRDETFVERAIAAAQRPEVSPVVRRSVIESCDRLRRRQRARRL
jgi:aminopeptidase N